MSNEKLNMIVIKFNRIINKFSIIEKSVFNVSGIKLTSYQIHLIDTIGRLPEMNVTEIAKTLGVTKGAVSQKLTWLEKKGFIVKLRQHGNNRDTFVKLTDLGWQAYDYHEKFHEQFDKGLFNAIQNISDENEKCINDILDRLDSALTDVIEEK